MQQSNKEHRENGYQVTRSLMLWLIDNYVRQPPYIAIVSKKQLWWGNGRYKNSDYPKGLLGALGLINPSEKKKAKERAFYGYDVIRSPYTLLNTIINSSMRKAIINQATKGGECSDIRTIMGRGYIREDGTLDPEQKRGISCYVLFAADHRHRTEQNEWISQQPYYVRLQILRNMTTHKSMLMAQINSALQKIDINKNLLLQEEYMELDTGISRSEIPWDSDE